MGGIDQDQHLQNLSAVPLFPLPNVVLFPRAVLPLHIFEERYKEMTADALIGDRQIAMSLLRPGWEKSYYGRPAIEPVVCVGTILTHERLPDGKYNFLLQGHTRARIVRERVPGHLTYRLAELAPLSETPVLEIDFSDERARLQHLFDAGALSRTCLAKQFRQLLDGSFGTPAIIDLIAFNLLEDIGLKQQLLGEPDVRKRVETVMDQLQKVAPHLPKMHAATAIRLDGGRAEMN